MFLKMFFLKKALFIFTDVVGLANNHKITLENYDFDTVPDLIML